MRSFTDSNYFLVNSFLVLALGTIYTLSRKFQNIQQARGPDGVLSYFHHPMYQSFWLFVGMSLCLLFKRPSKPTPGLEKKDEGGTLEATKKKAWRPIHLLFPAACDALATIVDSLGLIYTHVSVHQMLKGFILIFTFLISLIVLKKKYKVYHYVAVIIIFVGLIQVGRSNIQFKEEISAPNPLLGNILVIIAQLLLSLMFVYEEYILKDYEIEILDIVGWEGLWGVLINGVFLMFSFNFPDIISGCNDNFLYATYQAMNSPYVILGIILSSLAIGPFNYFGTILTKISSAANRCTIDSLRMITVWTFCVTCSFEEFRSGQLIGYMLALFGTLLYNNAFDFTSYEIQLKPALPRDLGVKGNLLIFKQQIKNIWGSFSKKKEDKDSKKPNYYKPTDGEAWHQDNESNSLTLEEILETMQESSSEITIKNK